MAEPILKWAGGKRQILDSILNKFPENYTHYHEPMIGGGAVFFEIEPDSGSINDLNTRLINFYRQVRDNPKELIETLKKFKDPNSDPNSTLDYSNKNRKGKEVKNYYYQQRELFNKRPNNEKFEELKEAARLLYLNRTCYNGLYRENQSGEFNTPIGSYKNPDWVRKEQIKKASTVLQDIKIYNQDFNYVLEEIEEKTSNTEVFYFDPPYKPISNTEDFTNYTSESFGKDEQERLIKICVELSEKKGAHVIVSNSGIMKNRYENNNFKTYSIQAKRSINSDGSNRGEVKEILAVKN